MSQLMRYTPKRRRLSIWHYEFSGLH